MMPCPARIKRTLGSEDQLSSLGDAWLRYAEHRVGTHFCRRRRGKIELRRGLLRIFRYVDQHRPRAARLGDTERIAQDGRYVFGARDHVVMLGHRQRDAGDVHFLKSVSAQYFAAHLAGNADHRNRVQHRGRNACHHVGRTGA